jgi:hypothetical protein
MIEAKIISWIVDMKKKTKSLHQPFLPICNHVFCAMNDINNLNRRKIKQYLPEKQKQHSDRAYTREEISQLLQFCDERERALVLLLALNSMTKGQGLDRPHFWWFDCIKKELHKELS